MKITFKIAATSKEQCLNTRAIRARCRISIKIVSGSLIQKLELVALYGSFQFLSQEHCLLSALSLALVIVDGIEEEHFFITLIYFQN